MLKRPKAVPKKRNLDQNINDSKSHIWSSFLKNIISGIRSLIKFKKPRKITSDFFNKYIFVQTFQWTSSEYFFYFRFSSIKPQSKQKTSEKDHLTYNTVSLKKPHSFYKPQLTWLYVFVISRPRFRVNPHPIVSWMSKNSLLGAGAKSEVSVTATGNEPRTT